MKAVANDFKRQDVPVRSIGDAIPVVSIASGRWALYFGRFQFKKECPLGFCLSCVPRSPDIIVLRRRSPIRHGIDNGDDSACDRAHTGRREITSAHLYLGSFGHIRPFYCLMDNPTGAVLRPTMVTEEQHAIPIA